MSDRTLIQEDATTSTIEYIKELRREVNDAATVFAMAEARHHSFLEKATIFASLYQEAEAELQTAEGYSEMFLRVKSDLVALRAAADESNLVSVEAFSGIKQVIVDWQEVTTETLKAAEAVTLTANEIQRRKATNALISDDLVNNAIAASKTAQKTVSQVILAFKSALSALSVAKQANNTTELTDVYVDEVRVVILKKELEEALQEYKKEGDVSVKLITEIQRNIMDKSPLESTFNRTLVAAKAKVKLARKASEAADEEQKKAKEEVELAQFILESTRSSFLAAEQGAEYSMDGVPVGK